MEIESALRTYLIAGATTAGNRIYELILPPKATYPAVTFQRISNVGHPDIDVDYPRIQISAWAKTPIAARTLAREVEFLLDRFKGRLGPLKVKRITKLPSVGVIDDRAAALIHIPVDYKIIYVKEW